MADRTNTNLFKTHHDEFVILVEHDNGRLQIAELADAGDGPSVSAVAAAAPAGMKL
jgi:hypothetical protein